MSLCRNIPCLLTANLHLRSISTSCCLKELQRQSVVKVVDNSIIGHKANLAGKKVKIIHVYNKTSIGRIGDMVKVTILGQMKKAYIVGCVQKQKPNVPRFDTNNIVLLEENGVPTGTRIRVPIPSCLRGKDGDFTKILSMASKFV